MKVLRKRGICANFSLIKNTILVEDQIYIPLTGFGDFTATAQKITDNGILFMFDDCVASRKMNEQRTNKGGYDASDLCKWMSEVLLPAFPVDLREHAKELTLPTYGQLFGHDALYHKVMEPDNDEQLPLMAKRKKCRRLPSLMCASMVL